MTSFPSGRVPTAAISSTELRDLLASTEPVNPLRILDVRTPPEFRPRTSAGRTTYRWMWWTTRFRGGPATRPEPRRRSGAVGQVNAQHRPQSCCETRAYPAGVFSEGNHRLGGPRVRVDHGVNGGSLSGRCALPLDRLWFPPSSTALLSRDSNGWPPSRCRLDLCRRWPLHPAPKVKITASLVRTSSGAASAGGRRGSGIC